jgi:adenylate kinase family enzyme
MIMIMMGIAGLLLHAMEAFPGENFLIDGFPRTMDQLTEFEAKVP